MTQLKQKFDLRVVVFDGARYALYLSLALKGHDIYSTAGRFDGRHLFRHSHHASGQSHLRVGGGIVSRATQDRPDSVSGKVQLDAASQSLNGLNWNYKPSPETTSRRNIIVDLRNLPGVPSFTAEVWAIERNNTADVEAVLTQFSKATIIVHEHINSTDPELVALVWTLTNQRWQNAGKATL
jgi:hypothetical protein